LSDSIAREAAREAITIAAGLPRAEVEQRARRAFESANDIRARLRGLPDTAKRAHAVTRARTWADILHHMDSTGEPQFCGYPYDDTPPAIVRAVWIAWDWLARQALLLNVAALTQGLRDVLGAKPITFHQWPEPPPGIEPAPAVGVAGADTAPAIPGDGDASSSGGLQQPGYSVRRVNRDPRHCSNPPRPCSHPRRDRRPARPERRTEWDRCAPFDLEGQLSKGDLRSGAGLGSRRVCGRSCGGLQAVRGQGLAGASRWRGCAFTVVPLDVLRDGVRGLIADAASLGGISRETLHLQRSGRVDLSHRAAVGAVHRVALPGQEREQAGAPHRHVPLAGPLTC
jgi:hypothetical protein